MPDADATTSSSSIDGPRCVLAVYAHRDDPEVSCAGTLARWADQGAAVHLVIATRGEKGTRDPMAVADEVAARRAVEIMRPRASSVSRRTRASGTRWRDRQHP